MGRPGGFLSGWLGGGRSRSGMGAPRVGADGLGGSPASPGGGSPVGSRPPGSRPPGSRAALFAVAFAVASLLFILIGPLATVDDRGDVVPRRFGGVYLEARSLLTGEQVEATETTVMSAYGPMTLLLYAVPMLIAVTAYVAHKRTGISRPLTFGMLGLAVGVFITGAFFMPSLIALAIGSFQARRAELPARAARRATRDRTPDGDGTNDAASP